MNNLLQETMQVLLNNGKTLADIKWVGNNEISFSWKEFSEVADFTYEDGFGSQKIAEGLVVVGDDWWLERTEYDGSEQWEFKTIPIQSKRTSRKPIKEELLSKEFLKSMEYMKQRYERDVCFEKGRHFDGRIITHGREDITDKDLQWFLDKE